MFPSMLLCLHSGCAGGSHCYAGCFPCAVSGALGLRQLYLNVSVLVVDRLALAVEVGAKRLQRDATEQLTICTRVFDHTSPG
jgi:hypothetical protein